MPGEGLAAFRRFGNYRTHGDMSTSLVSNCAEPKERVLERSLRRVNEARARGVPPEDFPVIPAHAGIQFGASAGFPLSRE
jgi:hypothetical protein